MPSSAPPLNALRAFEAVARHLSFSLAAVELNVTPGALSHQVRGLEEHLGVLLFERRARGIVLTQQGKALYPGLQAAFGLLRDAVAGLRATTADSRVLVVGTPPGFTSKWLAARLYRFAEKHPDIELRIASSAAHATFTGDGVDVAIRNLPGPPPDDVGLVHEKLLEGELIPVCSPKLTARFGPFDAPGKLAATPLIHDDQLAGRNEVPTWSDWARAAGVDIGDPARGLRFSSADHAIDAALEGAGLLLTHAILAHDELFGGRLARPFGTSISPGRAYYFVCPKRYLPRENVQSFRSWLLTELNRPGRDPP